MMTPKQCAELFWEMNTFCSTNREPDPNYLDQTRLTTEARDVFAQKLSALSSAQTKFDADQWTEYAQYINSP